jgi:VCBS repeat protein
VNNGRATVNILLGSGDGSFDPAVVYRVGQQPPAVAIGDFNGDYRPDLAVSR